MNSLIFATALLGALSQVPNKADSTYANPSACPPRYVPTPMLFCRLSNGDKWHEQGTTCHNNPAERGSSACECNMENVPSDRVVTYCKAPEGFK